MFDISCFQKAKLQTKIKKPQKRFTNFFLILHKVLQIFVEKCYCWENAKRTNVTNSIGLLAQK